MEDKMNSEIIGDTLIIKSSEIHDYAFCRKKNIRKVVFKFKIEVIGYGWFNECDIRELETPNTVVKILGSAFYDNNNLTILKLNEGLLYIDGWAFYCCDVRLFDAPSTLKEVGDFAFGNNKNLVIENIGKNLESIGAFAFEGCMKVSRVELNEGLVSIGEWAFKYCNIEEITIPSTVEYMGSGAFKNNPLKRVYLYEGSPISKLSKEELDEIFGSNVKYFLKGAVKTSNLNSSIHYAFNVDNIDLIIDSFISKSKIERLNAFYPETITVNNATDEQEELISLVLPNVAVINKDEYGNNITVNIKNIGYLLYLNIGKVRKLKIIMDKDSNVSDMFILGKLEELEKYNNIESLIVVGADSFVKKASILFFYPNVIFRDKETIEELEEKGKNIITKNMDPNILEIEKLRDELGNLIEKLPDKAKIKLASKLNNLILEYNEGIEKHNNSPKEGLTLEPDYFSLDMGLILKLKYLWQSLKNNH